ncbi:AsmA family protein [Bordetella avium]|uniref:Exported protein n=2 Tax=Bordetella avium TaxID=521 RepID=Q2KY52_BORA1|nr:AsmA family protein [Bordetella avium]RIQ49434.1 AsmA family protein [Bordetella avium]RIQ74693.1 AsmA family protein [Bordetella avium]CAJ48164.1 putative exported protein [Bordetella avium 197N]
MKTWFKRILIGLVVLVLVAVVGLAIFLLTFDPNAYKYKLEELVQERYHRTLTIEGEIELSLFPRIGLAVQGVSLSEANSPEVFASIDSMRLAVAVWPLLSNNLVVDHVTINGFKARIAREKSGQFNFENLVGGVEPSTAVPANAAEATVGAIAGAAQALSSGTVSAPRSMQIDIAGLDLKDGELQLQDALSGMAVSVTHLNANTGRVTFNQPFDVSFNARVEGGDPRFDAGLTGQALLRLDPSAKRYSAQRLDLRMEGKLPSAQAKSLAVRGNLAFNGASSSLDVAGLEVVFQGDVTHPAARLTGVEASVAMPKLSVDPHKAQLQIDKLAARAKGNSPEGPFEFALDTPSLHISPTSAGGDALTGRIRNPSLDASFSLTGISGNAAELDIKEAKIDAAVKQGERVVKTVFASPVSLNLTQRAGSLAALKGDVNITDPALPKGSLQIPVIGSLSADLLKDQASAKINAVLEGGKFDLMADLAQLTTQPQLKFALAVDTLDLDKLMPALPVKPAADGKQEESKPSAKPAAPAKPRDDSINLSGLIGPSADGTVKIGQLVMRGLKAAQVGASIKLDHGKLDISGISADLYNGKLAGGLSVNAAEGNKMAAKLNLTGVAIEPLLMDVAKRNTLSGNGSLALDLSTAGNNSYALTSNLGGTVQLRLREGAVKGINLSQTLKDLKALVNGQGENHSFASDSSRQTDFTAMDADMTLAKGVGTVKRLDVATDFLRVSQGSPAIIDFVNSGLDFVVVARVTNTAKEGKELADLRNLPVPVLISGSFEKPLYTVQWREIASALIKRGLESTIKDALGAKGGKSNVGKALKGVLNR